MTKNRTPDEYLGYNPDLTAALEGQPDSAPLRGRAPEEPPDPEYEQVLERLGRWQVITAPPGFLEQALAERQAQREAEAAGRPASAEPPPFTPPTRVPRPAADLGGIRSLERPGAESRRERTAERRSDPPTSDAPRSQRSVASPLTDQPPLRGPNSDWTASPHVEDQRALPTRPGVPVAIAAARNAAGDSAPHVPMHSLRRAYQVALGLVLVALVGGVVLLWSQQQEGVAGSPSVPVEPTSQPRHRAPVSQPPREAPPTETGGAQHVLTRPTSNASAPTVAPAPAATPPSEPGAEPKIETEVRRHVEAPNERRAARRAPSATRRAPSAPPVASPSRPTLEPTKRAPSAGDTRRDPVPARNSDEERVW